MNIKLINFRKHANLAIQFDGVTRIYGDSGIGKSTIFEAIYWCLYGKLRKVKPHGKKNSKTEVLINMPIDEHSYITVHRSGQRAVTVLQCMDGDEEEQYTGDMAQNKIDTFFGPHNAFLLTSYLRTDMLHPLIGGDLKDKREYTSLIFPDAAKYGTYRDKLISIRRNDQSLLDKLEIELQRAYSAASTLEETNGWLSSYADNDIQQLQPIDEKSIENTIKELKEKRDAYSYTISRYSDLKGQLDKYSTLAGLTEENIVMKENELEQFKLRLIQSTVDSKTKEERLGYLQSKFNNMNNGISVLLGRMGISPMDLPTCERIIGICNSLLSIAESSQELKNRIEETKEEYMKSYNLLIEYEQSLLDQEYNEKLENILECPHCQGKLQYIDTLISYTGDCTSKPIQHNISRTEVSKLRVLVDKLDERKSSLATQYNKYQSILTKENSTVKDIDLKTTDIRQLKNSLEEYRSILYDREAVQKDIDIVNNDNKEYIFPEEHKTLKSSIENIAKDIRNMQMSLNKKHMLLSDIEAIENKYSEHLSNSSYIDTINQNIDTNMKLLDSIRQDKERKKLYMIYKRHKGIIASREKEKGALLKRLDTSKKLEVIFASTYGDYVSMRLREIEWDIATLGKIFFDESMNISLSSGKEDAIGAVKPGFDIHINYGGIDYGDDMTTISTGERKRLSIILLIVLTKYMNGKFIMIDEGLSSVDMNMRAIIIAELLKLNIPILLTSHDEVAGPINEYMLKQ